MILSPTQKGDLPVKGGGMLRFLRLRTRTPASWPPGRPRPAWASGCRICKECITVTAGLGMDSDDLDLVAHRTQPPWSRGTPTCWLIGLGDSASVWRSSAGV